MPKIVTGGDAPQQTLVSDNNSPIEDNVSKENQQDNVMNETPQIPVPQTTPTPAGMFATPTIVDTTVPVVVFVGPPSSGKSMILVRLAKYLRNKGYTIATDPTFLNTPEYQRDCQEFHDKLNTVVALDGSVKFLLVNVYQNGRVVAKLLEAPGEDFYTTDPEKIRQGKNMRVEPYLATIMTSTNPKSYVTLLDLDSEISFRNDQYHRDSYAQRFLTHFLPAINLDRDRIVLLYNKIDKTMFGSINGCHDPKGARKDAEIYYKQIFAKLKGGLFNLEQFAFKTFCTGMFAKQTDNFGKEYQTYNVADDKYPRELWKEIIKKF